METGASLLQFALPGRGNVVSLDPNARLLLAGADQGYLFARDPNGDFVDTPATLPLSDASDTVLVAALSADAGRGLLASYHGEVLLFDIDAGVPATPVRWQVPGSAYLHFAALSADGAWAFAGANTGELYALDVNALLAGTTRDPSWSASIPGGATTIYGVAAAPTALGSPRRAICPPGAAAFRPLPTSRHAASCCGRPRPCIRRTR